MDCPESLLPHHYRTIATGRTCFGVSDEWHLLFLKAIEHKTFGFASGFHEPVIRFGPPLFSARFISVWSICDSMNGDGIQ